jgi:hypothetical protein
MLESKVLEYWFQCCNIFQNIEKNLISYYFFLIVFHVAQTQYRSLWQLSSLTSGGRPQVSFRALFQVQMGTREELQTFCKLDG